ncbi:MAG: proline racemase family protein [Vicinamibacterales bacterium]
MGRFTTVDAHCGGAAFRLLAGGAPTPRGRTMREKTAWLARHADPLRRTLMLEPRGHRDLTGAMLTEPARPGSHAGLVFMNADGFAPFAGHGVMAAAAIAFQRGLIVPDGDGGSILFDTAAGTVRALRDAGGPAHGRSDIAVVGVPSFVLHAGLPVQTSGRHFRADVAFGGQFYAVVDAESVGVGVSVAHLPWLRALTAEIVSAVEGAMPIVHPLDGAQKGLAGAVFTGPAGSSEAQLRAVTVLRGGSAGRGPSVSGMCAVMAVLTAMGFLSDGSPPYVQEGLSGATFTAQASTATAVGDVAAIVPTIRGSVWVTGDVVLYAGADDPFASGLPE